MGMTYSFAADLNGSFKRLDNYIPLLLSRLKSFEGKKGSILPNSSIQSNAHITRRLSYSFSMILVRVIAMRTLLSQIPALVAAHFIARFQEYMYFP